MDMISDARFVICSHNVSVLLRCKINVINEIVPDRISEAVTITSVGTTLEVLIMSDRDKDALQNINSAITPAIIDIVRL
ncbi:hypothetical protein CANARDRAFT_28434 [[Candida] arabinofermentans NRRL YB-2248]|uniref:Uncharacterized protein n=1 Tax=[Candida] arabinofermentans NRRL YB-2248 TaxID=983967 RepID=A0A1E4T089_9ASCO|nr:hypothetical protein CANARDRAFT_28434 [[Candida] arabinofermentans NRRL YB-2248]